MDRRRNVVKRLPGKLEEEYTSESECDDGHMKTSTNYKTSKKKIREELRVKMTAAGVRADLSMNALGKLVASTVRPGDIIR
jgi:hypothetical protein